MLRQPEPEVWDLYLPAEAIGDLSGLNTRESRLVSMTDGQYSAYADRVARRLARRA